MGCSTVYTTDPLLSGTRMRGSAWWARARPYPTQACTCARNWFFGLGSMYVHITFTHTLSFKMCLPLPFDVFSLHCPFLFFSESGLSAGAAAGLTFIVTLVVTAAATATIVILIVFFCFRRRGSYSSTATHSRNTNTPTTTKTTVDMYCLDQKPPQLGNSSMDSKPSPAKKPGRPLAPPPKPPVPTRPTPPTYNGY